MESPGTYVTFMRFMLPFLLDLVFSRTAVQSSGGYHLERVDANTYAVEINCENGTTTENQGSVVKYIG